MRKIFNVVTFTLAALLSANALAATASSMAIPDVKNKFAVIVIDNKGRSTTLTTENADEALSLAQASRIASNRSVKVRDILGLDYEWTRVRSRNQWKSVPVSQDAAIEKY